MLNIDYVSVHISVLLLCPCVHLGTVTLDLIVIIIIINCISDIKSLWILLVCRNTELGVKGIEEQ